MVRRIDEGYEYTDNDYSWSIAEEVANIMQDMDWQDSLDDSYDNPDEAWDAYVDQVLSQLESDPQEVIDWLEDEEGSDVHRSLIRNIIKCFGGSVSESVKKKNSNYRLNESARGYWGYLPNERLDDWINDTEYEERWYNDRNIRGYKLFSIPEDFENSGDPKYDEVFGVYSTNDNKLFYGTKEEAYKELVYYLNNSLYEYRHDL